MGRDGRAAPGVLPRPVAVHEGMRVADRRAQGRRDDEEDRESEAVVEVAPATGRPAGDSRPRRRFFGNRDA